MVWRFDPNLSQVEWACRYLGLSTIRGSFGKLTAEVNVEGDDPSTWSMVAEIDPRSVSSAGLAPPADALRSKYFLDAEAFPEARFRATRFEHHGDHLQITGELTLHGVTRPIVITGRDNGEAVDYEGVRRRGFSGTTTVRRSEFGIPGDPRFIANDIELSLEVQFRQ